jgi:hypothetical protein
VKVWDHNTCGSTCSVWLMLSHSYPMVVDSSFGSKARVVARYLDPIYPHLSVAYKDSKATYTEGDMLRCVSSRLPERVDSYKVKLL